MGPKFSVCFMDLASSLGLDLGLVNGVGLEQTSEVSMFDGASASKRRQLRHEEHLVIKEEEEQDDNESSRELLKRGAVAQ